MEGEEKLLEDISSHLYQATSIQPNPYGKGNIITYEHRQIEPKIAEKINDLFLFSGIEPSLQRLESIREDKFLSRLGFSLIGQTISMPDTEALIDNWNKLRESDPELPHLRVYESDGIASDEEFIEAWNHYDVTISKGIEKIHDTFFHVIPTLRNMYYNKGNYQIRKVSLLNEVYNGLGVLDSYEQKLKTRIDSVERDKELQLVHLLKLSIAFLVDGMSASIQYPPSNAYNDDFLINEFEKFAADSNDLDSDVWNDYLLRRGFQPLDKRELINFWAKIHSERAHLQAESPLK